MAPNAHWEWSDVLSAENRCRKIAPKDVSFDGQYWFEVLKGSAAERLYPSPKLPLFRPTINFCFVIVVNTVN